MRIRPRKTQDLTNVDSEISEIYEALDAELERIGHHNPAGALERVAKRELEAGPKPINRRGFLSYLRWCMAHPYEILMDGDTRACPCGGSGWIHNEDKSVGACPKHRPPRADPRYADAGNRAQAARGREQDERRGL